MLVIDINNDAEDLLYTLAGNKGETIGSLKQKTLDEIMSFSKRIVRENGRH